MTRIEARTGSHPEADCAEPGVLVALRRLDRLIQRTLRRLEGAARPDPATDPFRGLHIGPEEIVDLLGSTPGALRLAGVDVDRVDVHDEDTEPESGTLGSRLAWLRSAFVLSPFDIDVLLVALAPELDLRYERLYAYLHDDVTRKRPTVDLALNLLCRTPAEKIARRAHFARPAPLIEHALVHLIPDPVQAEPSLLAHYLRLDEQVVRFVLGQPGPDSRLGSIVDLVEPVASAHSDPWLSDASAAITVLARHARDAGRPLRLFFEGTGHGKRRVAEALAGQLGARVLIATLSRLPAIALDVEKTVTLIFREARFHDAVLFLDGVDALEGDPRAAFVERVLSELARHDGVTILTGPRAWAPARAGEPIGLIPVPFGAATFAERRACWAASLGAAGMTPIGDDLDALASRFRLAPPQIGDAVAVARGSAALRAAAHVPDAAAGWSSGAPSMTDLFRAARAQSGDRLGRLARRIEPKYGWADIVLPADQLARLRELSDQARYRHVVHGDWGFERKLSLGRGLNALFSGPPGTGKTMAAEVIGRDLELELYAIDLAQVVSKYIGETEKNLQAVFQAAEDSQAILFFDEADALFGKRSEVKDAHDRYANIEIGYLLQKMEAHEGIAILATNLRKNMDEAFLRRMQFTVDFPFPDEESRRRIWDGVFPEELPRARDVDVFFLARQFKLSGGHIRNIALAAAFLAAADRSPLTMAHLIRATRREYQKLGWLCSKADFGAYHALVQDADA